MLATDKWKAEKARKQAKLLELRRRKTQKDSERLAKEVGALFTLTFNPFLPLSTGSLTLSLLVGKNCTIDFDGVQTKKAADLWNTADFLGRF